MIDEREAGEQLTTQAALARVKGLRIKRERKTRRIDASGRAASDALAALPRFSELGGLAQACVPGLYAWIISVAPAAWLHGSSMLVKVFAVAGALMLLGAAWAEMRAARAASLAGIWGFVGTSALVWTLAPRAIGPLRFDVIRGLSGMIGWALFAYAVAAPPTRKTDGYDVVGEPPLRARAHVRRGGATIVAGGVAFAIGLQAIGWGVLVPERALLVRLVCVSSGIGVVMAATSIALARHGARARVSAKRRVRIVAMWVAAVSLVGLIGAAVALFR
jgi:hypothetical protein